MSLKKTFFLALILIAGLLFVFKVELPRQEQQDLAKELFAGVERGEISRVEISTASNQVVLENSKSHTGADQWQSWKLEGLPKSKLDRANLSALFTSLLDLKIDQEIPAEEVDDSKFYGLDVPVVRLKVSYADSSKELIIGKKNDFINKRYMQVVGAPNIYLIEDALFLAASKSKQDFRSSSPVTFLDSDVDSISLSVDDENLSFKSAAGLNWKITSPGTYTASDRAVSALTRTLRNMRASEFIDDAKDLAQYGLEDPDARIEITYKKHKQLKPLEISLSVLKEKAKEQDQPEVERVYMMLNSASSVFRLQTNPLDQISKPLEDYREKRLFEFPVNDVIQLDVQHRDGKQLSIVRVENKWAVNGSQGDATFVENYLRSLSELEASAFPLENRDYGFSRPHISINVRVKARGQQEQSKERLLVIGAVGDDGQSYFAGVDDLSEPFILSPESLKKIAPRAESLVKVKATPSVAADSKAESSQ